MTSVQLQSVRHWLRDLLWQPLPAQCESWAQVLWVREATLELQAYHKV